MLLWWSKSFSCADMVTCSAATYPTINSKQDDVVSEMKLNSKGIILWRRNAICHAVIVITTKINIFSLLLPGLALRIGRSHLHTLHFILVFPATLASELWVAVHRLLPVPTVSLSCKVMWNIFQLQFYFTLLLTLSLTTHVSAISAHLSRLWSCCVACKPKLYLNIHRFSIAINGFVCLLEYCVCVY